MIVAEGADCGGRRITRTDMTTGKSVILANTYQGQPFNFPNDVAIDAQGRIYFTDSRYIGHEPITQPVFAVYRIDPDGSVHRIIADLGKPNGIAISPDQKTLYVSDFDDGLPDFREKVDDMSHRRGAMALIAFDLMPDGAVQNKRKLVDYAPHDGADSLMMGNSGQVYAAIRNQSQSGIAVYASDGTEQAFIPTPEIPTNMAFGREEEKYILYITAGKSLYKIQTTQQGYFLAP